MKVGIKIMPREVILDTQGRAVQESMKAGGFKLLETCRVGKYLELNIKTENSDLAHQEALKMLNEGGLYNPLIEKFEVETLS